MADNTQQDPQQQQEYNKYLEDAARISAKQAEEARSLTAELQEQLGLTVRRSEADKNLLNLAKQLAASALQNNVELGRSGQIQKQVVNDLKLQNKLTTEQLVRSTNLTKQQIADANKIAKLNQSREKVYDKILKIRKEMESLDEKKRKDRIKELKDQESLLAKLEDKLTTETASADRDVQRLALANQMQSNLEKVLKGRYEEVEIQKTINKYMGVGGSIIEGLGKFLQKMGLNTGMIRDTIAESKKEMYNLAEEAARSNTQISRLDVLVAGLIPLMKGVGRALTDPATLGLEILNTFFKINAQSVQLRRLTGQSATSFNIFANGAASAVDILQTAVELTKEIGFNAQNAVSAKVLANTADLKVELGLASDEAAKLGIIAQTTTGDVDQIASNIVDVTSNFNKANHSAVSQGIILRDVARTSDAIKASFAGNPEAIAKAAVQARRLGLQLDQINQIADSFMNFETSIQNELEARLLTGRNINLAKARELALNNDLAGLGKELFKNSVDIAEFGKMNRIQQEAQAKALGLTRDQLAKIAYQRAIEAHMTEKQAAAAAGVNLEDMKRIEIQKNFQKALEKIAGALAPILDAVGSVLSIPFVPQLLIGVTAAYKIAKGFGLTKTAIFESVKGLKAMGKLSVIQEAIMGKLYKGGQFMPGGKRAAAGGERAGGLIGKLTGGAKGAKGAGGFMSSMSKINTTALLKGAAAMAVAAGSIYIFGKAVQELDKVNDWGNVAKGLLAFTLSLGAVAAISYVAAPALYLAAPAILAFGAAVALFGLGLNLATPALRAFGSLIDKMSMDKLMPLMMLGPALFGIAAGLGAVALSGLAALPVLGALTGLALVATPLIKLMGVQGGAASADKTGEEIVNRLDELISLVKKGGDVYLDSDKVGTAMTLGSTKLS